MATPFEAYRGSQQQRIARAPHVLTEDDEDAPDEGSFCYELGHSLQLDVNLAVGDKHDISQVFERPEQASLVRCVVRITAPSELPVGMTWRLQVLLNGTAHYSRLLDVAGRELVLRDIAVRLATAHVPPTTNTLTFRLELV